MPNPPLLMMTSANSSPPPRTHQAYRYIFDPSEKQYLSRRLQLLLRDNLQLWESTSSTGSQPYPLRLGSGLRLPVLSLWRPLNENGIHDETRCDWLSENRHKKRSTNNQVRDLDSRVKRISTLVYVSVYLGCASQCSGDGAPLP